MGQPKALLDYRGETFVGRLMRVFSQVCQPVIVVLGYHADTGSGVRVKLLEAFAAGIPVVSTLIGAEGLAEQHGTVCALSDDPAGFAAHTVELLENPAYASQLAVRARQEVTQNWDMEAITRKLVGTYEDAVSAMRQ